MILNFLIHFLILTEHTVSQTKYNAFYWTHSISALCSFVKNIVNKCHDHIQTASHDRHDNTEYIAIDIWPSDASIVLIRKDIR